MNKIFSKKFCIIFSLVISLTIVFSNINVYAFEIDKKTNNDEETLMTNSQNYSNQEDKLFDEISEKADDSEDLINSYVPNLFSINAGGPLVIALDPGHDNRHAGANPTGYKEEERTLNLAFKLKSELEKYNNVRVVMTRYDGNCPNPGTSSSGSDISQRVSNVVNQGANVYVSLHFNSSSSSIPCGAEVITQNPSYNSTTYNMSYNLSSKILNELVSLGLNNRGIYYKNDDSNPPLKYPNGQIKDYYAVHTSTKLRGIPGIIVEHCFLSNYGVDRNFYSSDAGLQKLAVADAKGIAKTYGLTLKKKYNATLSITNYDKANGSWRVNISNVPTDGSVKKVELPTWCSDVQSETIHWDQAVNDGNGKYHVDIKASNFKDHYGLYYMHLYITDKNNERTFVTSTQKIMLNPSTNVSASYNTNNKKINVKLSGFNSAVTLNNYRVAIWSETNGQDDLRWEPLTANSDGTYSIETPINNYKSYGTFNAHIYANSPSGSSLFIQSATFNVEKPSISSFEINNADNVKGTYQVLISNPLSEYGIKEVKVASWTASNQNDLKWYSLPYNSLGTYTFNIDIKNHNYNYGTYNNHVYIVDNKGESSFVCSKTFNLSVPECNLNATKNSSNTNVTITTSNLAIAGGLNNSKSKVEFAVWSDTNGQDDLKWYKALGSNGSYSYNVNLATHKSTGWFNVHCYATNNSGAKKFIKSIKFNIEPPRCDSLSINYTNTNGDFTCNILNLQSSTGINEKEIKVAVWSSKNGQDDLVWYPVTKSGNNYYFKSNISKHKFDLGEYNFHLYLTDNNDAFSFVKSLKTTFSLPNNITLTSTIKNDYKTCTVNTNLSSIPGGIGNTKSKVEFAVWSDTNGQDDLKWYKALGSNGDYKFDVNLSNHKSVGLFNVHCYATNNSGVKIFIKSIKFDVKKATCSGFDASYDNNNGNINITTKDINYFTKLKKVEIALWSDTNGQDDLICYTASVVSDNTTSKISKYKVVGNIDKHKFNSGNYNMHMYVTDENGAKYFVRSQQLSVNCIAKDNFQSYLSSNQMTYTLKISTSLFPTQTKSVSAAIWSEAKGQDDLIWYTMQKTDSIYVINIPISNHKTAGKYNVHVYYKNSSNASVFAKSTTFNISSTPSANMNFNTSTVNSNGLYTITINNVQAVSGIESVKVAVWCSPNQSDLIWYNANKVNNTTYNLTVNVRNHQYGNMVFHNHCYVMSNNKINTCVASNSFNYISPANITFNSDMNRAWTVLMNTYHNPIGVAGLLGNIYAESGVRANNLQNSFEKKLGTTDEAYTGGVDSGYYPANNFIHDSAGYGIAQWTFWSRKQNLYNYMKSRGLSIGNLDGQLNFLISEIAGYSTVNNQLYHGSVLYDVSTTVLRQYEKPADSSDAVAIKRASYALAFYNHYK